MLAEESMLGDTSGIPPDSRALDAMMDDDSLRFLRWRPADAGSRRGWSGFLLLLLAIFQAHVAASEEVAPRTELDVLLNDGTHLIGILDEPGFKVTSEFGKHLIPLKVLSRIEAGEDKKSFLFILKNEDEVGGVFNDADFILKTEKGVRVVSFKKVSSIELFTFVPAKKGTLEKGLQVHFKFDGGKGAEIANEVSPDAPAKLVDGKREKGTIVLDGKGDHVHLPNDKSFEKVEGFTVSIWTKVRSFGPGGYANEHGYLVNKGNNMWWNPAWCLGYSKKSGAGVRGVHPGPLPALFIIGTERRGGHAHCRVSSKTLLKTGRWYHVLASYDGKVARIYVNGRPDGEFKYTGLIRQDSAPLLLGGGRLGGRTFGDHFTTDASVDNFRFYNRALTQGEVRLLYKTELK